MSLLQNERLPAAGNGGEAFQVICLCAEWCGTCRDYRADFNGLASQFPHIRFRWVDIEEQADDLGDLDVDNFPTIVIMRANQVLFYGVMLPFVSHLRRTIETFIEQTPEQSQAYVDSNSERLAWQADQDLLHLGNLP